MAKPNIYDLEFSKRMEDLIDRTGKSLNSFAAQLGVSPPTVARWIKGEADPTRSNLIKIAEATGVSLEWLALGIETIKPQSEQTDIELDDEIVMINSFESINVSAGFGSFNDGITEPDGKEPYATSLIASLGVKARHCGVFWARGNSMRPTITSGDQLLVDFSKNEIRGDNIYLIQNDSSVWVKRIKQKWDKIELISDNKEEYDPISITAEEAYNLQIIGQVIHIGHSLI